MPSKNSGTTWVDFYLKEITAIAVEADRGKSVDKEVDSIVFKVAVHFSTVRSENRSFHRLSDALQILITQSALESPRYRATIEHARARLDAMATI
jgi:hypothetical protein